MTAADPPIVALQRLVDALRIGTAPDPDDVRRFVHGVDTWRNKRCTLDDALGLDRSAGERHPGTTGARAERDQHLRSAFACMPPGAIAADLDARHRRYFTDVWRRERNCTECPNRHLDKPEEFLWRALKAWPVPVKLRRLQQILVQ